MTNPTLERKDRMSAWAESTVRHYKITGVIDPGASRVGLEMIRFDQQRSQDAYEAEVKRRLEELR